MTMKRTRRVVAAGALATLALWSTSAGAEPPRRRFGPTPSTTPTSPSAPPRRPERDDVLPPRIPAIAFDVGLDYASGRGTGVGVTVLDFRTCVICLATRDKRVTFGEVFGLGLGLGGGSEQTGGVYLAAEIELGMQASVLVDRDVELGLRYSYMARVNGAREGKSVSRHYRDDFWTVTPMARFGPFIGELLFATDLVPFPAFLRSPTDKGRMFGGSLRYLFGKGYHVSATCWHFTAEPASTEVRLGIGMNY